MRESGFRSFGIRNLLSKNLVIQKDIKDYNFRKKTCWHQRQRQRILAGWYPRTRETSIKKSNGRVRDDATLKTRKHCSEPKHISTEDKHTHGKQTTGSFITRIFHPHEQTEVESFPNISMDLHGGLAFQIIPYFDPLETANVLKDISKGCLLGLDL